MERQAGKLHAVCGHIFDEISKKDLSAQSASEKLKRQVEKNEALKRRIALLEAQVKAEEQQAENLEAMYQKAQEQHDELRQQYESVNEFFLTLQAERSEFCHQLLENVTKEAKELQANNEKYTLRHLIELRQTVPEEILATNKEILAIEREIELCTKQLSAHKLSVYPDDQEGLQIRKMMQSAVEERQLHLNSLRVEAEKLSNTEKSLNHSFDYVERRLQLQN